LSEEELAGVRYAAALNAAFDAYSDEVYSAALLDYGSVAEAEAVVRTLSDRHFDLVLEQELAKQELTTADFASFAEANPNFFHAQQKAHWGKLQELERVLAAIPGRVKPATEPIDDTQAVLP
jgi:hypothetical protein